jgi:sarcosine oxidase subunit beta
MSAEPVDFLVVGAGIVGTTIAIELAAGGASVKIAERRHVGAGSTAVNAGGVRQQFLQPLNVRLASETVRRIERFPAEQGEEVGFRQTGYLLLYGDPDLADSLRQAVAVQNELDVPSRLIGHEEIGDLLPGISLEGVLGAAFCATDGYLDPRALVTAYGRAAQRAGVEIVLAGVDAIESGGGRVRQVGAGDRRFSPGVVVNAAGAWAANVARLYGGDLPISPLRSEVFVLDRSLVGGRLTPMVLDRTTGLAYHSEGRGLLVSAGATAAVADPDLPVEPVPERFFDVRERLARRLPELAEAGLAQSWAGLVETTADFNPIVGWTHLDNLFTAAGFSGHGMCLAPGLAPHAADLIRGESGGLALDLYRPDRFDSGREPAVESLWNGASGLARATGATG